VPAAAKMHNQWLVTTPADRLGTSSGNMTGSRGTDWCGSLFWAANLFALSGIPTPEYVAGTATLAIKV
jgi:hypothetical protein